MANSDITSQLQQFLDTNTPGGYFQTETNLSSDDLNNRINGILDEKSYLTNESTINYNQIADALRENIKTVGFTGYYKDLLRKPNYPEGYTEWLQPDSITETPSFHKVAFTGKYSDLDFSDSNNNQNITTISWDQITGKPALATFDSEDISPNTLFPLAQVAISGSYDDLNTKISVDYLKTELGLKDIAFSGDYNDLNNTPQIASSNGQIIDNSVNIYDLVKNMSSHENNNTNFCNFMEGTYNVNDYVDYNNRITIKDILENLILTYRNSLQIDDENFAYNKKIAKIITNKGAFELIDVSELDKIIVLSFSPLDSYNLLNAARLITNSNIDIEKLEPYFIIPTLYYQINQNQNSSKVIIKLSKILTKTDVKNDIIKIFDITTSDITNFNSLIESRLDTSQKYLSTNQESITLQRWLEDVIQAHNEHALIKIKNYFNDIILTDIKKRNNIYLFCFTTATNTESNTNWSQINTIMDGLAEGDNPLNALDQITFENYFIYFIYDTSNNYLWIKRKIITQI